MDRTGSHGKRKIYSHKPVEYFAEEEFAGRNGTFMMEDIMIVHGELTYSQTPGTNLGVNDMIFPCEGAVKVNIIRENKMEEDKYNDGLSLH